MATPAVPRLPAQLDAWDESSETDLEIDRAHVRNLTLANAVKLYVDTSRLEQVTLTVISGVGSLNSATLRMAGAEAGKQDIRTLQGPFEIVSLIGLGSKPHSSAYGYIG